jgi:hypothetical protein
MSKTLIFEGAGCTGTGTTEVPNCRIRTRIRNNSGRLIYLEMGCCHFDKKTRIIPKYAEGLEYATHIDFVHYDDAKWDKRRCHSEALRQFEHSHFEYNKENILKFVNENLNCSFDDLQVINDNSVRVFDTEQPLCDSSNEKYEPYKDIEININQLNSVKPISGFKYANVADYSLSWGSINKITPIKKWIESQTAREQETFKTYKYKARFMWDTNGTITELEITSGTGYFCCMSLGAESVQYVIDLVLNDNIEALAV